MNWLKKTNEIRRIVKGKINGYTKKNNDYHMRFVVIVINSIRVGTA